MPSKSRRVPEKHLLLLLLLSHFSCVRLCETPETAAHQAPPSLGFSRPEHWSGLPFYLSTSALLTIPKPLTVWVTKILWKILQEMGTPDHLSCLLRNLYADQEATVRTGHETTDWFQIGKGVKGCILSPCLFNLYVVFVQSLNRIQLFATPWTAGRQASLFFTISWSLLKLRSIESVM